MKNNLIYEAIKETNSILNKKCTDLTMSELLKSQTKLPKRLCGNFIYDSETVILFGPTGVGKTILTFQICDAISKGLSINPFQNEVGQQKILYFNLEMTTAQLKKRYSSEQLGDYNFNDNFQIIQNIEYENEADLIRFIRNKVEKHKPGLIVVDNISFVIADKEKSENAKILMKSLNEIKIEFNTAVLCLGHCPKIPSHVEMELKHLSGSANLSNFCDTVFSISRSNISDEYRYLKLLKHRASEGTDKVFVLQINNESNFLHFDFKGMSYETEHLKKFDKKEKKSEVIRLRNEGKPVAEVSKITGVSTGTVFNWTKNIYSKNEVHESI